LHRSLAVRLMCEQW